MSHLLLFACSLCSSQSTAVLQLLARFGMDTSLEVSDSGRTLIEFAIDSEARPDAIALLQEVAKQRESKKNNTATHATHSAARSTADVHAATRL